MRARRDVVRTTPRTAGSQARDRSLTAWSLTMPRCMNTHASPISPFRAAGRVRRRRYDRSDQCPVPTVTMGPAAPIDGVPGGAGHAVPSRRHRPPPWRRRTPEAGGVSGGAGHARPTHRRTLPPHPAGRGRRGAARAALARLDPGHVRPAGPGAAGAVPTGGGAVLTHCCPDRGRRHR